MSKEQELGNIFNQAQKTLAAHQRCVQALEKHYTKNPATFATNFINMVKRLLLIFKRDAHIERAVQLVVTFACKTEIKIKEESFAIYLVKFLLDLCDMGKPAKQAEIAKAIRFRSCQIIAGILSNLPEDTEPIDDDIWDKLSKVMLERTMDKIPAVRVQAIAALQRLQETTDPSDPILVQYLKLMNTDTNKDVRKAVLSNIGISKITLPDILKRTRDVLPEVRKHAFATLSRLEIKNLSIAQRNTMVKNGLNDRDSSVREACLKTLEEWLQSRGNVIEFLKCYDVETYEDNAVLLLKQLLPRVKIDKEHLALDVERISPELAVLFRMYCENLKQDKNDDLLEDTVPELMQYCELLANHRDDNFVLKQLLQISSYLNLQNEAGRKALSSLLRHLLLSRSVENSLIEKMMLVLREIHPVEDDYNRIILESISEVREPLESLEDPETQQALKELDEYMEELDAEIAKRKQLIKKAKQKEVIETLTAELAAKEAELKEIEERENMRLDVEEWAWLRCLTLTQNLLRYTTKSLKDGGIAELKEAVFAGGIQHENPEVREAAMGCLGVYCLLDKTVAFKHVLLLRHALDNDDISVRCAALKTLCDIILVFGSTFKVEVEDKVEDYTEALGADPTVYLAKYLRSEESSLRDIAAQGLSRIFITKGASSKLVMKELVLAFFVHGDSSSGSILQQCLSVFFPTFAFGSEKNQFLVANVAIDIFRDVAYAPKNSPLAKVQLQTLLQFLVHLTDHNNIVKKTTKPNAAEEPEVERKYTTAHNYLAEQLLMEFMTNPTGKEAKFLAKILATLSLDKSDQELIHRLRALADVASSDIAEIKDKVVIKSVSTFEDVLKSLDGSNEIPSEDLKSEVREKVEEYSTDKAQWLERVEVEEARARKEAAKAAKKAPAKSAKGGKKKKEESDEEVDSEISSVSSVEDESIELESDDESPVEESDESDIEDEDDEEIVKPKPKNTKTIKDEDAPPRTRKIISEESDSDLELSDDEEEKVEQKPVKDQPRLSNASVKSAQQKKEELVESDGESDSLLMSDDEEKNDRREAEQIKINTPKSKAKTSKRIIEDSDDEDDEISEIEEEPTPKKSPLRRKLAAAAPKPAAAKKSRAIVSDSEEDEDLSLSLSDDEDEADDEFEEDNDISDISEIDEDSEVEEDSPVKKKAPAKKAPAKKKRAIESDDEAEEEKSAQVTPVKAVEEESDKENDDSAANTPVQSPSEAKPVPKPTAQPAAAKAATAGKVQRTSTGTTTTSARTGVTTKPVTSNRPSVVPAPRPSVASATTSGIKKPTTVVSRPSTSTAAPRPSIASSTTAVSKPTPRLSVASGTAAPAKTSTVSSRPSITPATRPSIASSRPSLATAKPTTATATAATKPVTKPAVSTKPSVSAARPSVVSKELRSEIDRVLERDSPDTKKENLGNKKPNTTSSTNAVAKPSAVKKPAVVATKPGVTRPSISYRGPVEQTPMVKNKPNPALLNTTTKNLRADIDSLLD